MATTIRPRISADFLKANQRRRIIDATARCIVERSYPKTTVAHIVGEAGIARNTFYDNFASKEAAAVRLVRLVIGDLPASIWDHAMPLAIDLAAPFRAEQPSVGALAVSAAGAVLGNKVQLDPLEVPGDEDPHLSQLPPGRHGLPRDFVVENQRRRLIVGAARAIYENGYAGATIADIVKFAAVSRRTFYEHFTGVDDVAHAMVEEAEERSGFGLEDYDFNRGLDQLWAEMVAAAFCGDAIGSEIRRKAGLDLVECCLNLGPQELAA